MIGEDSGTYFRSYDGSTEDKKIKCTIDGIEGTLIFQNEKYIFTRTSQGEKATIEKGTEIKIETQQGYAECLPIIWIGNNNNSYASDPMKLVDLYKDFLTSIEDPDDYIIIIPIYYEGNKEYTEEEYEKIKTKMQETFNDKCLDLKAEGWTIDSGYDNLAEIIKDRISTLGFEVTSISEENPNVGQVEFDGTINVGDEITLEYIPLGNKLEPSPGTLMWLIQNEDTDLKNAALQFFSIDGFGNLIVANWVRTTTIVNSNEDGIENIPDPGRIEYTLSTVKINYKTLISEYTMPFDYLWAFLVMGEDTEFVNNLTQLTLNSEINITLYDELTIVENDVRESHTEETKTRVEEDITEEYDDEDRGTNHFIRGTETDHKIEDKYNNSNIVTETNKVRYRLTKADVWCLKYEVTGVTQVNYNGADGVDTSLPNIQKENFQKTTTTIPDEDWKEIGTDGPTTSSEPITHTITNYDEGKQTITIGTKYVSTVKTYYKKLTNQQTITTIITSGYNYTEGVINTEEKTEKTATQEEIDTRTFNEPNFVKYYLYSQKAIYKINSVYSWLFEILEKNRTTVGMVDITKYMIYKATERDFGITSFDFSIYNDEDFKDAIDYNPSMSGENNNGNNGDDELGSADLDGSYNVDGVLLSNPIVDPIDVVGSYPNHGAVDINPTRNGGTPVYAAADGTVVAATYHYSYGNYVLINHANGVSTLYAHAQSLAVSSGQTVTKGQLIMYEGSTGNSSGPHVHFEIRRNGVRIQSLAEDMFRQLGFTIVYNY